MEKIITQLVLFVDNFSYYQDSANHIVEDVCQYVEQMFLSKQIGKAKVNLYACMFPPKKYPKTSIRHLGKGYRFWVDRQFEHHYDAYICNSDYTRKWLCKVWNVKGKDEMIYPPVFSGAFQEEISGVEKRKYYFECGEIFCCWS